MAEIEKGRFGFFVVPNDQFGVGCGLFEHFPVWSEHYDYDEIDEIVSWGIDRDWLMDQFKKHHDGSAHCYYPILQTAPRLPSRMRVYIKADIRTAKGRPLTGYVAGSEGFLSICHEGEQYGFFSDYPENNQFNLSQLIRLKQKLDSDDPVIPFKFTTPFIDSLGEKIEGELNPSLPR